MTTEAQSLQNRTRLIAFFDGYKTRDKQSEGWSNIWKQNESDLWDRGRPSPALIAFLEEHAHGQALLDSKRSLRAFVPGCGRGHDVAMLALHGFDTWGLEVSELAVDTANENIQNQLASPATTNFGKASDNLKSNGRAEVILGDFFGQEWEQRVPDFKGFDIIYDYTFLCALLPSMRKDWATRMTELLSPEGVVICLEFPMWKPLKARGPPWGLNGVHWNLLAAGADGVFDESGNLMGNGQDQGKFERVVYWQPPESFEQSRGEDMISVWKLK